MHALLIALAAMLFSGCHSRQRVGGGVIFVEPTPLVTLVSAEPTAESRGRGYPLTPFPMPYYPLSMLRAGIVGEVIVRLVVGPDGGVKASSIVESSQREFEAATLAAVGKWRFFELVDQGQKGRAGMVIKCTIRFGFDES